MVDYVKGNLLEAKEMFIAHGCNAQGKMGSGVALAVKNKYKKAYLDYKEFLKNFTYPSEALGIANISFQENKIILNLITQENYGYDGKQYVSYNAINSSLNYSINELRQKYNFPVSKIAISKIGSTLGGGNWNIIEEILKNIEYTQDIKFTVYSL